MRYIPGKGGKISTLLMREQQMALFGSDEATCLYGRHGRWWSQWRNRTTQVKEEKHENKLSNYFIVGLAAVFRVKCECGKTARGD
jgi:hypothetical protein